MCYIGYCVVHRPIYDRFMGFYENGFLLYIERENRLHKTHKNDYRNDRFFSHTNPYILNVTQQCRCTPMLIFRAWATCGGNDKNKR